MSVYIKGLEMPKNCVECVFYRKTDPIYDYCCISSAVPKGYVPEDCPLIPVPDHGRLIDADKLMDALPDDFSIPSTAAKVIEKTIIPTNKEDG